jgi:hypothetical protein
MKPLKENMLKEEIKTEVSCNPTIPLLNSHVCIQYVYMHSQETATTLFMTAQNGINRVHQW